MNKIKLVNDSLEIVNVDSNIKIECFEKECLFAINEIKITVIKDCSLDLDIKLEEESKLNFNIKIEDNVTFNLNILSSGVGGKIQYKYNLNESSTCNVFKFQNVDSIKEMIIAELKGERANLDYNFKTISNNKETYDYHIFHRYKNTTSNIKNNGVCVENGNIIYQVSSFVPKNITGCIVNQNNRIINLTNNKCEILPNLYIDCNDVEASHSALIGKFSDEEMFYIQSRGIDYNNAIKLLITGFLVSDISNKKILKSITKNINKYWR